MRIHGFILLLALVLAGCDKGPPVAADPQPRVTSPTPIPEPPPPPEPRPEPETVRGRAFEATYAQDQVQLVLPWDEAEVWRGYEPIVTSQLSNLAYFTTHDGALGDPAPHGLRLYYRARGPGGEVAECEVVTPAKELPELNRPRFHVDKLRYTLGVLDGEKLVKRYPIALGKDPRNRKYCQDNASTPEGIYQVYNLQPEATYYRAFDIDYPNEIDRIRHQLAISRGQIEPTRSIGGEIQIHGMGIGANWTFGCMALRNEDMDELFANRALAVGLEVFISGSQIDAGDRTWIKSPKREVVVALQKRLKKEGYYLGPVDGELGAGTALALGQFQSRHKLPVSCQLDANTRRFLKK